MAEQRTNPYSRPVSDGNFPGAKVPKRTEWPSRKDILLINAATWVLLVSVPVSLNFFAFVFPIPLFVELYWAFNYWVFLPFYFISFGCVNLILFRDSTLAVHLHVQMLTALIGLFAQIPFLFIMLATYRGPW